MTDLLGDVLVVGAPHDGELLEDVLDHLVREPHGRAPGLVPDGSGVHDQTVLSAPLTLRGGFGQDEVL